MLKFKINNSPVRWFLVHKETGMDGSRPYGTEQEAIEAQKKLGDEWHVEKYVFDPGQ